MDKLNKAIPWAEANPGCSDRLDEIERVVQKVDNV